MNYYYIQFDIIIMHSCFRLCVAIKYNTMGNCLNSCVMAATYIHDKYNDRFDNDDCHSVIHFTPITPTNKQISIHVSYRTQ